MHVAKQTNLILLLLCQLTFAYEDNDIDGVDDKIDQCLNTSFDEIVGEDGCLLRPIPLHNLTFKIGMDSSFNQLSELTSSVNLFTSYTMNNIIFSLSTYSYYESYQNSISGLGDFYLSAGYRIKKTNLNTLITLGSKISSGDDVGTGEHDLFGSVSLDYYMTKQINIFLYGGYTFSGDSTDVDYDNFLTLSFGSGYTFTNQYYSALSYDYSQSAYPYSESYHTISWLHSYTFSKRYFATLNYAYGLDDQSFTHTFSFKLGVNFD